MLLELLQRLEAAIHQTMTPYIFHALAAAALICILKKSN